MWWTVGSKDDVVNVSKRFGGLAMGLTLVTFACGSESEPSGEHRGDTGGVLAAPSGGADTGGGGRLATGGEAAVDGGSATGGAATTGGGLATGGAALGGATADGGADTGGAAVGGGDTGGALSDGGTSDSGGAAGSAALGGTGTGDGGASGGSGTGAAPATGGMDSSGGAGGSVATLPEPIPSSGCDAVETANSGRFTIDVDGTEREYILELPDGYDSAHPYPIIFAWHGGRYDADWVANGDEPQSGPYFGIQAQAQGSVILVAPQALGSWNSQDISFVDAMVTRFEAELCLDTGRVFSAGFSMGGIMTLTIGCERGNVFRAIAAMSGSLSGGCPDSTNPIAYFGSHGDEDPTISPDLGAAARDEFVRINGCSDAEPVSGPLGLEYQGCMPGYPVIWHPFTGVHEPPPDEGVLIWGFLSQL